jgi:hypothetical protein
MWKNYRGNGKILGAVFFSAVLIVGAYTVARGVQAPSIAQASTEAELLKQIAARDSDADGLSDWEEALYGTDAFKADTRGLGMTDAQAVATGLIIPKRNYDSSTAPSSPTSGNTIDPSLIVPAEHTITKALSEDLTTSYASAVANSPNGHLTEADMQKLRNRLIGLLDETLVPSPDFLSYRELKVSGSGEDALKAFAIAAEAVFMANKAKVNNKGEIAHLKDALQNDDKLALGYIVGISMLYYKAAVGLSVLPVPEELVDADKALINALYRLSLITADFTRAYSDPLLVMHALKQYPGAVQNLGDALIRINTVYKTSGVKINESEPGASFVYLVDRFVAKQKNSSAAAVRP